MHKCVKVEPFFRHHFHTCESFVVSISQHGLYNFAYSDSREDVLLSVIVENTSTVGFFTCEYLVVNSFFIEIESSCFI